MDSDEENDSPFQVINRLYPCQGVMIKFPEGKNIFLEWPWKEQAELAMAWGTSKSRVVFLPCMPSLVFSLHQKLMSHVVNAIFSNIIEGSVVFRIMFIEVFPKQCHTSILGHLVI